MPNLFKITRILYTTISDSVFRFLVLFLIFFFSSEMTKVK